MSQQGLEKETLIRQGLRNMSNTPEGRAVLIWFLSITQPTKSSFSENPHEHARMTGRQEIGQALLAVLTEIDVRIYANLLEEIKNARSS